MFKVILLEAICLLWAGIAVAQSQHFYADGSPVGLSPVNTSFIVTADSPAPLAIANTKRVKAYQNWPHRPYAIVRSDRAMTTAEVVAALGFDTDEVQISPGYALPDGFVLYPTPRIAVRLGDKHDESAMRQVLSAFDVKSSERRYGTYRIELNKLNDVFAAANALYESGLTEFAHPDFYAPIERHQVSDPLFAQQFQLHNTGQTIDGHTGTNDVDCNAPEAWAISLGSASITVAVFDDGLEDHEDLRDAQGQSRIVGGFTPATDGNGAPNSAGRHGVACAGTIAATHNDLGVRGVAPLTRLLSVNIFAGGETAQDLADAFNWADSQGADVLSNSWGYRSCVVDFPVINNAISYVSAAGRGGRGAVVVFSSGNDYKNCVTYPANQENVIAVGAVTNSGVRSTYSNYGPKLDLVAPSDNYNEPGAGVRTTDRTGSRGYGSGSYTASFGGTSAACPVVSGVAALVLGYNPELTSVQVKNILCNSASDMGPAGFDGQYGYGRVNAFAALQAAGGTIGGGAGGGPTCSDGRQNGQETGLDCGGPNCADCPPVACNGIGLTLDIQLDRYPGETRWTIKNEAGQIVHGGGPYGNLQAGSTVNEYYCLAEGCYVFTIRDTYGDGICCSNGNGGYALTNDGEELAAGGNFGALLATEFCLLDQETDNVTPPLTDSLVVSNETSNSVRLSWSTVTDSAVTTGYRYYVDSMLMGTTSDTTVIIDELNTCTEYVFTVAAFNEADSVFNRDAVLGTTTGCLTTAGETVDTTSAFELSAHYFETSYDGWTDGGADCYRFRGQVSYEGRYCVRLRDNSGGRSAMTSPPYDLTGMSSAELAFVFYPNSMENGEDFLVEYQAGGAANWRSVARYVAGNHFSNDTYYDAKVAVDSVAYTLNEGARFRIRCDASSNADRIYVDRVIVTADTADVSKKGELIAGGKLTALPTLGLTNTEDRRETMVWPNPARDRITVSAGENIKEVSIFGLDGRRIKRKAFSGAQQVSLRVDDLPTGLYLVSVLTEEERITEKIVVR